MIRKIAIDSLRTGMQLHGLLKSHGVPHILDNVHIITNDDEINSYARDDYEYAYIFDDLENRQDNVSSIDLLSFDEEIGTARELRKASLMAITNLISLASLGKRLDIGVAKSVVNDMVDSVIRNKDALLSLDSIDDSGEYTYCHSINVSTLSLVFARELGYKREEMRTIGLGALLHDIGIVVVPDEILSKPRRLTDDEFIRVKKHVVEGLELLSENLDLTEDLLNIVYQHHERYDGSGYPKGLKGTRIHPYARIVGICDLYDAMKSERPYRYEIPQEVVLSDIFDYKGTYFQSDMVESFILCFGINSKKMGILAPMW